MVHDGFRGKLVVSLYNSATKTEMMRYMCGNNYMEVIAERKFPKGVETDARVYNVSFRFFLERPKPFCYSRERIEEELKLFY